jgi:Protein of unknown function (DUF3616)
MRIGWLAVVPVLIGVCEADRAAAGVTTGEIQVYEGMCEASGAIAVPAGSFGDHFLIVDNEDNILRLYAVGDPHAPPVEQNVSAFLGLNPDKNRDDIDLEAATWFDGEAVLIGSLGRNGDGEPRPARGKIFAVAVDVDGTSWTIGEPNGESDALVPALAAAGGELAAAIGDMAADNPDLAPKDKGINLEGMSVSADGAALFLGFRNPVPDDQALLVKLLNPKAVLFNGEQPVLDPPIRLDLGGRGIRSMEYSPAAGAYFIVAGPVDREGAFDIYRWVEGEAPATVPGAAEALAGLAGFAPEGLIVDPTGTRLQLFSDNEECTTRSFQSVVLTIE